MRVIYHPEASAEIAEVLKYYGLEAGEEAGLKFDVLVHSKIDDIAEHPLTNPLWRKTRARRLVMRRYPYAIFYDVAKTYVRIVALAHTSRRPGYWNRRLGT